MLRFRFHAVLIFGLVLSTLLAGCASHGSNEADRPTLEEFDKNLNQGEGFKRLLSRMRNEPDQTELQQVKAVETDARVAQLERELQLMREAQQQPATSPLQLRPGQLLEKMGLVFAADIAASLQDQVEQALLASGADFPVAVASTAELDKQLAAYDCTPSRLDSCGGQLAVYPGVHYLAEISRLQVSANQAVTEVRLHDLVYGVRHSAVVVELPAVGGELSQRVLRGLTDKIMTDVLTAARATPWSTRAFDHEGSEIFLAAGERSGLQVGMALAVHGKGRLVRSPSGGIAGWIPGPKKGELKVTGLFGDDYAIAELTDGEPPTPADPVLKP